MDCRTLIDRLDELLADRLRGDERAAALDHLRACSSCRALREAVADNPEASSAAPPDLISGVLASTTGSTCTSAHDRLCDYVDRRLGAVDDELVREHVESCAPCADLARVLVRATEDLPLLAELEPDASFVGDVLARTALRRPWLERWTARALAGVQSLAQRPRIAWEGAYVGTFVLVLLFGVPTSPLAGVPRKALDLARVNPVVELQEPVEVVERRVAFRVRSTWTKTWSGFVDGWDRFSSGVAERSSTALENIREDLGTLAGSTASEQETQDPTDRPQAEDRVQGDPQ
jgi:predicted anti-sigma-YlaC factor YlaD